MLRASPLFLLRMINHSLFLLASFIFATQILHLKTLKQTRATDPGATPRLWVAPGFGQRDCKYICQSQEKQAFIIDFFKKFSKLNKRSGLSKANISRKKSSGDFLPVCQGRANLRALPKPRNRGGSYHSLLKNYPSPKASNRLPFYRDAWAAKSTGNRWVCCRCVRTRGQERPQPRPAEKRCRGQNKDSILPGTASVAADGQRGSACHSRPFLNVSRIFSSLPHLSKSLRLRYTLPHAGTCILQAQNNGNGVTSVSTPRRTNTRCLCSGSFKILSRQTERRKQTAALPLLFLRNYTITEPVK